MTGLEKITEKILSAAQADARETMERARAQAAAIDAEYDQKAADLQSRLLSQAEAEGAAIVSRAKATAATARRNAILSAKSELVDKAFQTAYRQLCQLSREDYRDFLGELLAKVLLREQEDERLSRELYGSEDAPDFSRYELIFNQKDTADALGEDVLTALRRFSVGKLDRKVLDKLVLSQKTAPIDGGFLLRIGETEINCSLSALMTQAEERCRSLVSDTLFS